MCHVLVIEDDFLAADYIDALARLGGATSTAIAASEEEAVSAARSKAPDIMLCDLQLGQGSGRNAVDRICSELGPITTIFVTGNPQDCADFPGNPPVIAKPFLRDTFIATFQRHDSLRKLAALRS